MSKITVIQLLNKIANGEEVPLIKYRDKILHWNKEKDRFEDKNGMNTLYEMDFSELNDEVEIIEKVKISTLKKLDIEKDYNGKGDMLINKMASTDYQMLQVANKINEIIDYLEEKE